MSLKGSETLGQKHVTADTNRRIKPLATLADELAERGLMEEAVDACKAMVRLGGELANRSVGSWPAPTSASNENLARQAS